MTTMEIAPQGKIGRYVIQGELGRGAMGVVYRAQDPAIGRTVAVKTIRLGQYTDEREIQQVQERMMREAQAAGILSHNNIVTIYDIQHEDGTAFIFMEYVDGETLEKLLLADQPIDKQLILFVLRQAAEALDYAHQRGIVHRDVKPANIMVRRDGVAKIADFGVARMQSHSMTQAGQILGTPNYMSPEQISGKPVDGRADQYSLAVILYEVLTGEKPFVADSLPTLLYRVVSEPPVPAPRLNPTLSAAIDAVIQRALAKNPSDRFTSCSEFIKSLEAACQQTPGWSTQVRGGGLSQPTQAVEAPRLEPKAAPLPSRPAAAPAAKPGKTRINTNAVIAVALAAALVGAAGVGAKLMQDRQEAMERAAAARREPPSAPVTVEPAKPAPVVNPEPKEAAVPPPVLPPAPPKLSVAEPVTTPVDGMAVAIRSTPAGARVVIDEGKLPPCTTPCLLELPKGRHTASILLESYKAEMRIFYVPQDTAISVNLEKQKGMLEVFSSPPGATITIDGVEYSQKTPALIPLPVGSHTVVVSHPEKKPHTHTFEMRPEATISVRPNWGN